MDGVEVRTLTDGGQPAEDTAHALADVHRRGEADRSRSRSTTSTCRPELEEIVRGALPGAAAARRRGPPRVQPRPRQGVPVPPPPSTDPGAARGDPFPTARDPRRAGPHAPQVRHPRRRVACGPARRTGRPTRGRARRTSSSPSTRPRSRRATSRTSSSSGRRATSRSSGKVDTAPVATASRAWFCPGRGEKLAHRIAKAIGSAQRRMRIASPVISSARSSATLAQVVSDGKVDLAGVVDATQMAEVLYQWHENGERGHGRARCCGRR